MPSSFMHMLSSARNTFCPVNGIRSDDPTQKIGIQTVRELLVAPLGNSNGSSTRVAGSRDRIRDSGDCTCSPVFNDIGNLSL